MQYHLDTIPVWEAMEWKSECPLCGLKRKTELEEIERTLGASVMEPEVRIRFNERGVCPKHQQMLFTSPNRLGHALLMESHVIERLETLRKLQKSLQAEGSPMRLWGKNTAVQETADKLNSLNAHCVVCEALENHMARYRATFLHLWKTNADFQAVWKASGGVCLPHLQELLAMSGELLSPKEQSRFALEAMERMLARLEKDGEDLSWFIAKFDYRNQAEPWGDSKTATERAINRLRGWCAGVEPFPAKK